MPQHIELNPLSHFTIGTVGTPGQRTFYLQGGHGKNIISLLIEKMQAAALADSLEALLEELKKQFPLIQEKTETVLSQHDMQLYEPVESLFRVGNLGIGFDEELLCVVLVAYEMVAQDDEPNIVSFWANPSQVLSVIDQTRSIIDEGRPICGNCGDPIDADGHFCPHRNGHIA